jgi:hypothetical protein
MMGVIESLSKLSKQLEETLEISKRANQSFGDDYFKAELRKKIEDSILDNVQNASRIQLDLLIRNYIFSYYTEFNDDKELLRLEIQKRLRDKKLEDLGL